MRRHGVNNAFLVGEAFCVRRPGRDWRSCLPELVRRSRRRGSWRMTWLFSRLSKRETRASPVTCTPSPIRILRAGCHCCSLPVHRRCRCCRPRIRKRSVGMRERRIPAPVGLVGARGVTRPPGRIRTVVGARSTTSRLTGSTSRGTLEIHWLRWYHRHGIHMQQMLGSLTFSLRWWSPVPHSLKASISMKRTCLIPRGGD